MKRITILFVVTSAAASLLAGAFLGRANAAEAKAKYTIKEIMKKGHKGDDNMAKRVSKGQGSKADITQLVEFYRVMAQLEAPQGDAASWKEKTTKLLKAAEAVSKGEAGATEAFKAAVNCKACHSVHKPD